MSESQTSKLIITELKKLIRQRKITYHNLAPKIGMSESGLKKLMTSSDCSVSKLENICHALGVQLLDLIQNMDRSKILGLEYRETQEKYFESNHNAFLLFWVLVYERRTLNEAKKLLKLNDAALNKILFQLDKLNLLVLLPSGEVKVPHPLAIAWVGKSDFVRKIFRDWTLSLAKRVAKPDFDENEFFAIHYLQMTDETWTDFIAALKNVNTVFVNRAVREMRLKTVKSQHARWTITADRRSFVDEELI